MKTGECKSKTMFYCIDYFNKDCPRTCQYAKIMDEKKENYRSYQRGVMNES